jgi:hypothetical protein
MPNVLSTLPGQGTGAPQRLVVSGYVSQNQPAPAAFDDQLMVILPELSIDRPFGPCEWGALHGATLPVQGAPVTVVFDTNNIPVVVWWGATWSREQPTLITSGSIAATITTPYDGQFVDYLADQAKGIIWRFRYRAFQADGSTPNPSAYRWEFQGGGQLSAEIATNEATSSTTYGDLATVGPSIASPLAGDLLVEVGAGLSAASVGVSMLAAVKRGGGATSDNDALIYAGGWNTPTFRQITMTSMTAATVLKVQYRVSSGSGNAEKRTLRVTPFASRDRRETSPHDRHPALLQRVRPHRQRRRRRRPGQHR